MMRGPLHQASTVGVAEHGSAAVLVTVAHDGTLLDRRRVELIEPGLPTHPHHHEGSWAMGSYLNTPGARPMPLVEAVALVERVRAAAARGARAGLDALAASVPVPIATSPSVCALCFLRPSKNGSPTTARRPWPTPSCTRCFGRLGAASSATITAESDDSDVKEIGIDSARACRWRVRSDGCCSLCGASVHGSRSGAHSAKLREVRSD